MGLWNWLTGAHTTQPTPIRSLPEWRSTVAENGRPVILEVWSDTCPPCRQMIPVLETVATRYNGRVDVVTVGADADIQLLQHLQVRSTPTLIVYDSGEEIGRMVGFRPAAWFDQMISTEFPDLPSAASAGRE